VRFRELNRILPALSERGVHTQVVTSAVRPVPEEWRGLKNLEISVSIDGLQPEHDARRAPATYDRILKHIEGHNVTVHCTVTRQQARRPGYLEEFVTYWSARDTVSKILVSLYTPQVGEISDERLTVPDRQRAIDDLLSLRARFSKLKMSQAMIKMFATPPASPAECVFSRLTTCLSADLQTGITPCQFGGAPDCADCGCAASAGFSAIGAYRVAGVIPLSALFARSLAVGGAIARHRRRRD
jgi:sulfatase maturation enzyme AslB (radical SAM superfamily)